MGTETSLDLLAAFAALALALVWYNASFAIAVVLRLLISECMAYVLSENVLMRGI